MASQERPPELVRPKSANSSASSGGPASTSETRDRQKRFRPKVKTGCTTCRNRRVKCDESKPTCKRCVALRTVCVGVGYGESKALPSQPRTRLRALPRANEPALDQHAADDTGSGLVGALQRPATGAPGKGQGNGEGVGKRKGGHLVMRLEPDPPAYDFLGAVKYFLYAEWPAESARRGLSGPPTLANVYKPSFCLTVTAGYIARMAFANSTLPHPSVSRFLSGAWLRLYDYKSQVLTSVSGLLEKPILINKELILRRICDIISTDFKLLGHSWRTHIIGALNIMHMTDVISPSSYWTKYAMHFVITNAVVANTTSPANEQIWEIYSFTTKELQTIYSFMLTPENPWPTSIFLVVIRICYMRAVMASGESFKSVILPVTQRILDEIDEFSIEEWAEPYPIPEGTKTNIAVRTYITATKLYAILTLLGPLAHKEPYLSERLATREKLLQLIREASQVLEDRLALAWPLSVLAVTLTDDATEEKHLFGDILCRDGPADEFYNPQFRVDILNRYWASGKAAWDDCYFEPFPPLA